MGRQRGAVHFSGKIGDVQFYIDGNQGYAKLSNPVSKDRILKDPAYDQLRKNMAEFTGASLATDALQLCFGDDWKKFRERYLRARLQKLTRSVVKKGSGFKGKRRFECAGNLASFRRVELNSKGKFDVAFRAPMTVTVNSDRNTATLDVGAFSTKSRLTVPHDATNFRVLLAIGVLTDFEYVGGTEVYRSTQPLLRGLSASQYSSIMVCDGSMNAGFQLVASLPNAPVLPPDACLVVCLGIEFMEVVNSLEEIYSSGDGMQIYAAY